MKKLVVFLVILGLAIASCEKIEDYPIDQTDQTTQTPTTPEENTTAVKGNAGAINHFTDKIQVKRNSFISDTVRTKGSITNITFKITEQIEGALYTFHPFKLNESNTYDSLEIEGTAFEKGFDVENLNPGTYKVYVIRRFDENDKTKLEYGPYVINYNLVHDYNIDYIGEPVNIQQVKRYLIGTGKIETKIKPGHGIAPFTFTLYDANNSVKNTVTNNTGEYSYENLPVGDYKLVIADNGKYKDDKITHDFEVKYASFIYNHPNTLEYKYETFSIHRQAIIDNFTNIETNFINEIEDGEFSYSFLYKFYDETDEYYNMSQEDVKRLFRPILQLEFTTTKKLNSINNDRLIMHTFPSLNGTAKLRIVLTANTPSEEVEIPVEYNKTYFIAVTYSKEEITYTVRDMNSNVLAGTTMPTGKYKSISYPQPCLEPNLSPDYVYNPLAPGAYDRPPRGEYKNIKLFNESLSIDQIESLYNSSI